LGVASSFLSAFPPEALESLTHLATWTHFVVDEFHFLRLKSPKVD
jgi:hypothetical protein